MTETDRIQLEYQRREREIPADYYSLSRPAVLFAYTQRIKQTIQALARHGLYPTKSLVICEVGCGTGQWLVDFVNWGTSPRDLRGIDLDAGRLSVAQQRLPGADLRAGDAADLPWEDGSCDVVLQSTVFTSILDSSMKNRIAAEMVRVLRPGGLILWYDFRFNNPRNPQVQGIEAAEIRALFPSCDVKLTRVTLAPPIARLVVPISWMAGLALEALPFLRTHYLGTIRRHSR